MKVLLEIPDDVVAQIDLARKELRMTRTALLNRCILRDYNDNVRAEAKLAAKHNAQMVAQFGHWE